jgi:hypothetical protein
MSESHDNMRRHLHALPEPGLPDALWQRVDGARRLHARRRRLGLGATAVALAAVLALPVLAPLFDGSPAPHGPALVSQHAPRSAEEVLTELRAIDHALQAAYDRGASDAEIAPMWVARNELLAGSRPSRPAAQRNPT